MRRFPIKPTPSGDEPEAPHRPQDKMIRRPQDKAVRRPEDKQEARAWQP